MNKHQDNVTPIKTTGADAQPSEHMAEPTGGMDLSKIAIVVSLLSVVLSVIFFFGLNRNLSGLSNEVKDINIIRQNVAALDTYIDGILQQMGKVNTRIMELEEKPRTEAVRVLQESMIDDMLRRTEFMGGQLAEIAPDDAATAEKLERLRTVLQELRWPGSGAEQNPAAPAQAVPSQSAQ